MEKEFLFDHLDQLRAEVQFENIKSVIIPVYSLQFLKNNNKIPQEGMISSILISEDNLMERLIHAFQIVENEYPELKGIYGIFPSQGLSQKVLFNFLLRVNNMELSNEEWISLVKQLFDIGYENEGNKSGQQYSPKSVNQLGISILKPQSGTFYDGAAGIGGTAVEAYEFAEKSGGDIQLFGQEINAESWSLSKFNLLFHGIKNADIRLGDTLLTPAFIERDSITKFDRIMMHSSFSLNIIEYDELVKDPYNRFIYGKPPRRSADMAFIMHGLASLKQNGKAVFVVTNGVLFRGGIEGKIRQNMLAADVIESVIALPDSLHASTNIQTNLLIINKNKPAGRQGKILFIDAGEEFMQLGRRGKYLAEGNINKIVNAYEQGSDIKGFSKFVEKNLIEDTDLLPKRYVEDGEIEVEPFGKVKVTKEKLTSKSDYVSLNSLTESIYRGMNISNRSVEEGHGEYKVIKLSDVQNGEINLEQLTEVTLKRKSKVEMYLVQPGDVVISNRGTSIKIAVVPENEGNILLSHNFLGVRCIDKLNPYFLKAYLESPVGEYLLARQQIGTAILTINPKDLKDILVPELDSNDQKEIAEKFQVMENDYLKRMLELKDEKKQLTLQLYEDMGIRDSFEIIDK